MTTPQPPPRRELSRRSRGGGSALGWRHRQHYDMKATFITLVLDDGCDPHVIETRVTHTKKSHSTFDGYNRSRQYLRFTHVRPLAAIRCAELVSGDPWRAGPDDVVPRPDGCAGLRAHSADVISSSSVSSPDPVDFVVHCAVLV